jgi:protein-S-isoprenylcysteine O-methyltransferase Ste14
MRTLFIALKTAVYGTGFLFFFAWLALWVRKFDGKLGWSLPAGAKVPGIVLLALGGALGLSCICVFVARGRGTPAPFDAPKEFVAAGPYQYSRNPMYIGGLFLLAGLGLWERSISILLMTAVVFGIVHLVVRLYEEPALKKTFGNSYLDYCRRVPRWIPRLAPRP